MRMDRIDRRTALKLAGALFALRLGRGAFAEELPAGAGASTPAGVAPRAPQTASNFRAVYSDPVQREEFLLFLRNVFHLYPEDRFHALIAEIAARRASDEEIYRELQERLPEITPWLSQVSYALPALSKQKHEMSEETIRLLGSQHSFEGYVEIGSPGRYVKSLRKRLDIDGSVYLVNDYDPGLSPNDVFERGGLLEAGRYVPLGDYEPIDARIPAGSVDLVSNYIGFHHAPAPRLEPFIASIRRVLRPGGRLVVRDHDVDTSARWSMVALAHDVFNAGVGLSWRDNAAQIRNFTSLPELEALLRAQGFERAAGAQLQDGDPTRNTLLLFVRA